MHRRLVLILVVAALLLTAFSIALSRRDSRDWRANRSRRLLPFPWQDAVAVDVSRPGRDGIGLRRDDEGRWMVRIADDISDAVNPDAMEELSALATLTWREPAPGRTPPDPDNSVVLTVTAASGQTASFAFGDIENSRRAACIDGDATVVYGVNQDLLDFLDWPRERFRSDLLFDTAHGGQPDAIVLAPVASDPSLTVRLERGADGWRLAEPVSWPADAARIDLLLRWLGRLRVDGVAAEMAGDLEWFGFDPPAAYAEAWYNRPQRKPIIRRVEFGKVEENRVYVRETGRSAVFTIPAQVLAELSMDAANLVGDGNPDTVIVERLLPEPEKLTLTRSIDVDGQHWSGLVERGGTARAFAVDPPDAADPMRPLTALFTGLANVRIKTFLADAPPGADTVKWTAFPAWRIATVVAGVPAPAVTLYAANPQGELPSGTPYAAGKAAPEELTPLDGYPDRAGFALSVADAPAVMETFGEMAYLLCLPPYRYQSRRLLDLEPRAFTRAVVKGKDGETTYFRQKGEINEQWWRNPDAPEPLMDDNNRFVTAMLGLSQLGADGFVDEADGDIEKFGLDQPEISVIVYSSSGEALTEEEETELFSLAVGSVADDAGRRYARLNNAGPVFLLPARLAESLEETYR